MSQIPPSSSTPDPKFSNYPRGQQNAGQTITSDRIFHAARAFHRENYWIAAFPVWSLGFAGIRGSIPGANLPLFWTFFLVGLGVSLAIQFLVFSEYIKSTGQSSGTGIGYSLVCTILGLIGFIVAKSVTRDELKKCGIDISMIGPSKDQIQEYWNKVRADEGLPAAEYSVWSPLT